MFIKLNKRHININNIGHMYVSPTSFGENSKWNFHYSEFGNTYSEQFATKEEAENFIEQVYLLSNPIIENVSDQPATLGEVNDNTRISPVKQKKSK